MIVEYSAKNSNKEMLPLLNEICQDYSYLKDSIRADICYWSREYYPSIKQVKTYLIYDFINKWTKIGRSADINNRLRMLKCSNPNIKLIATLNKAIELLVHKKYETKLIHGEWYNLSRNDINNIIMIYNFTPTNEMKNI